MGNDVEMKIILKSDHERVLDFLRVHYYLEEPLTIGLEPKQQDAEDEKFNMSQVDYGISVMAVQKRSGEGDRIVGALIAGPKDRHEAEHLDEEVARLGPTKWGKMLKFLGLLERSANVCDRYGVEKVIHLHCLGVDTHLRGKSIGKRLVEKVINVGKAGGFDLITTDCTSVFSQNLMERCGFECINMVYYKDYKNENGEQIFNPPAPHDSVKTFAKLL